jgi:hypothetical protein
VGNERANLPARQSPSPEESTIGAAAPSRSASTPVNQSSCALASPSTTDQKRSCGTVFSTTVRHRLVANWSVGTAKRWRRVIPSASRTHLRYSLRRPSWLGPALHAAKFRRLDIEIKWLRIIEGAFCPEMYYNGVSTLQTRPKRIGSGVHILRAAAALLITWVRVFTSSGKLGRRKYKIKLTSGRGMASRIAAARLRRRTPAPVSVAPPPLALSPPPAV